MEALAALDPLLHAPAPAVEIQALAAALHEQLGQDAEALRLYRLVAARGPWHADVSNAIGRVSARLGQVEEALAIFDGVLAREPLDPEAHFNRGNALRMLYRREEAIEAYRAVLPLHAGYARLALLDIGRQQQALHDLGGARISGLQHQIATGGSPESIAFRLATEYYAWPLDLALIARLATELGAAYAARTPRPVLPPPPPRTPGQRLRIGLVSPDFWSHPVGYFVEGLIASAAARAADWVVYSHRDPQPDDLTERLRGHATGWHDVRSWSDEQLAGQVRADGVDVLVDLSGHGTDSRITALTSRPAPFQLSWLGYHGTTGLPYVDAVIADPVCVPEEEAQFVTEHVLRLPHTRFAYTPQPGVPPVAPSPARSRGAVTFGCFHSGVKIGPQVVAAWSEVAAALPQARWVIAVVTQDPSDSDRDRMRRRFAEAGFAPEHLELRGVRPMPDYLAGYADVDLVLDTFPFTGGTTTAEALWMGVPTLTLSSPGMVGRQGEQILTAAGLPQWVTHSVEEYVARAVDAGRSAPTVAWTAERATMRERVRETPLFDTERFGRDWMAAVRAAWRERVGEEADTDTGARDSVIDCIERGDYTTYFFVPDHAKESGGVKMIYDHVRCLNRHDHRAVVVHQEEGFTPDWLTPYFEADADGSLVDVPVRYLSTGDVPLLPEDTFVIPEGFPDLMADQDIIDTGCKRIVFCLNWYYVLNVLPFGTYWDSYGITDCLSITGTQTEYLRQIMPGLRCKQVVGHVPSDVFSPPEAPSEKLLQVAFIPSRDGGTKAHNVIKTFHALHPHLRAVSFVEARGLPRDDYAALLRESAFYLHVDEASSWGTAPIEAFLSHCLVAGWDGVGGREFLSDHNAWLADNGDIMGLARALGRLVEAYLHGSIAPSVWEQMQAATRRYTLEAERDSVLQAHLELRQERLAELRVVAGSASAGSP